MDSSFAVASITISAMTWIVLIFVKSKPSLDLHRFNGKILDHAKSVIDFNSELAGRLTGLAGRLDSLEEQIQSNLNIDNSNIEVRKLKFAQRDTRLDGHDAKFTDLNAKYAELCRRLDGIEQATATKVEVVELDHRIDGLASEISEIEPKAVIATGVVLCKLQEETKRRLAAVESCLPHAAMAHVELPTLDGIGGLESYCQPIMAMPNNLLVKVATLPAVESNKTPDQLADEWIKRTGREPFAFPKLTGPAFGWRYGIGSNLRDYLPDSIHDALRVISPNGRVQHHLTVAGAKNYLTAAIVKLIESGGTLPEIEP